VTPPPHRTVGRRRPGPRGLVAATARTALVLLLIAVTTALGASAAGAAPPTKLAANLGALWTTVLETPDAQNPFGSGGDAFECVDLGTVVAPFGPDGVASCTVGTGTRIFVAASSVECSTFEGHGSAEAELRACARSGDAEAAPAVTVDGRDQPVTEVETGLLPITLPEGNVFGLPAGTTGQSVSHGWVTLLDPLPPGTHTIVVVAGSTTIAIEIIVESGH
jgi:hypothetical protein